MLWIIDNGHGLHTENKRSPVFHNGMQIYEGGVNRKIAQTLKKMLGNKGLLLVPENKDISLKKRKKRIQEIMKDTTSELRVISIHANAYKRPTVRGVETYYYEESQEGEFMAKTVQEQLINILKWNNRGVKTADFYMLREHPLPSILTENGFFTNFQEATQLIQQETIEKIAQAHYNMTKRVDN